MRAPYNPRMEAVAVLGDGRSLHVTGRQAQALRALHRAGKAGVNAAQVSMWALCLTQYVQKLRQKGVAIETHLVRFDGGHYGQYVLSESLQSLEVWTPSHKLKKVKPVTGQGQRVSDSNSRSQNRGGKNG